MKGRLKFAIIGGDMRQVKLAELLAVDGHTVSAFAMDKIQSIWGVRRSDLLFDAVAGAAYVVLPLPLSGHQGFLNDPFGKYIYHRRSVPLPESRADNMRGQN